MSLTFFAVGLFIMRMICYNKDISEQRRGVNCLEIRQLLYFIEIYRQKSLSRAAERLNISPQGISMAMSRLEEELSCKLLARDGKELRLTPQGAFLLPHAEEIIHRIQICEEYFAQESTVRHLRKSLQISSAYGCMSEFAGELIFRFRQQHPDIWAGVREETDKDCEESVWNGASELGFSMAPINPKRFDSTPVFGRRLCLIVHKSHPFASRKTADMELLRTTPVMMISDNYKTYEIVTKRCAELGFQLQLSFTAAEIISIHRLVNANHGVGITVESIAEDLGQRDVCILPFTDPRMVWIAHLIKKRGQRLSPVAKEFEQYVIDHMRKANEILPEDASPQQD